MGSDIEFNTLYILMLTKRDIFEQRMRAGISLSACFDDWYGADLPDTNYNADIGYLVSGWIKRTVKGDLRMRISDDIEDKIIQFAADHKVFEHQEDVEGTVIDAGVRFITQKFQDCFQGVHSRYRSSYREKGLSVHVVNALDLHELHKIWKEIEHATMGHYLSSGGFV